MLGDKPHQKGDTMSNPSVGNPNPQNAPQAYPGGAYGAPAPTAMPKLPGRAPSITTLVIGILLMVVVAPIVFFGIMIAGVTKTEGNAVKGGTTANGSIVTVTADGKFTVTADGADPECFLMDAGGTLYQLTPYKDNEGVYAASGIPAGQYKLQCERIASSATVVAFNASPEVMTQAFVMPFVWGTVVGVAGLVVTIIGVVLLVKVNGKRRRIMQEAMMAAVR